MTWYHDPCAAPCQRSRAAALERQQRLTKPPGALGRLEDIAVQFAGWQATPLPRLDRIRVVVFVGDHGVARRGVSAFPVAVTGQMVANFLAGGAAISVLCRQLGAALAVVNMGTATPLAPAAGLMDVAAAPGTEDFTELPAMSAPVLHRCLAAGADQAGEGEPQLFIAGDMGIGNTTAAAAILAALLGVDGAAVVGRGTGVDDAGLTRKRAAVDAALARHREALTDPLAVLRCVGGLEIAAICGAYLRCAQRGVPVLVDGFIATAAALLAVRINPGVRGWLLFGHRSAERAHGLALGALDAEPLLDLGMRLGEGSGAALAVPILRAALALHAGMATFDSAGVAGQQP